MKIYSLLIILILTTTCLSQEVKDNQLTVYGKVKVFAQADRASITLHIKGTGSSLKNAFDDAKTQMNTISTKLNNIGLGEKEISTSFFQSSENYGDKAFLSSKKDYRATMTVTITTDSLELLEPIVIILSEGEVENISNISFELINYFDFRKKGLEKAISKAREKADLICKELGISYDKILSVEEIESPDLVNEPKFSWQRNYPSPFNAPIVLAERFNVPGETPSIYSQEISFYSEVKVTLQIINNDSSNSEIPKEGNNKIGKMNEQGHS